MVRFGWETFKKRPGFFIGVFVLTWIISYIASRLGSNLGLAHTPSMVALALGGVLVNIVVGVFVKMGTISLLLKAHDAPEAARVRDLWAPQTFWPYLGASILVGLIVIAGIILLIVPGIIWSLRYLFVPYLVIDRKLSPMAALRESSRITYGHKWELLGLGIVLLCLNIVGAIALLIGLLVTIPLTSIALVHAYRTLEHGAGEIAPASAAA